MVTSLWRKQNKGDDIDPRLRSCQRVIWQKIKKPTAANSEQKQ